MGMAGSPGESEQVDGAAVRVAIDTAAVVAFTLQHGVVLQLHQGLHQDPAIAREEVDLAREGLQHVAGEQRERDYRRRIDRNADGGPIDLF